MLTTAAAFLPFVLAICLWVMWSDLARMKIPNTAVLALAGVFLVIGPFVLPFDDYLWRVLNGLIMFFVGWLLTSMRAMGAGDAKFIAAAAPFVPRSLPYLVNLLVLFTVILLATFLLHRILRAIPAVRRLAPDWESWKSKKFPMGVPLALTLAVMVGLFSIRL